MHIGTHCNAACLSARHAHPQTIGKQAYDFLEAPRSKVWGAVHAVGGGSERMMPGFQSAFDAHGGRQTTEVGTLQRVPYLIQCKQNHLQSVLLDNCWVPSYWKAACTVCTGARGFEQCCSEAVPCMPAAAGRGGSKVHRGCAGGAAPRTGTSHPHGIPTGFPFGRRLTASSSTPVSCPHAACRLHEHTPAVCATCRTWRRPRRQENQTPVRHWTLGVLR